MLRASRHSLITHICRTPKCQTFYPSPAAIGRGALLLPLPARQNRSRTLIALYVPAEVETQRGFLGKRPLLHGAGVYTRLWVFGRCWVRYDSAVCRSAAFLCITRTNEDLITAALALFVCFCAPVPFLSPHGPPLL